jgi:glycosyltransferase involved in cell wall biosynthesis
VSGPPAPPSDLADAWVVIPVYNEARVLAQTLAEVTGTFSHVVCVDDASTDGGGRLAAGFPGVRVVRHPVNLGQGAALQTGIDYVLRDPGAARLVTFDADGQHRVGDAAALVRLLGSPAADGRPAQVALGSRFAARAGGGADQAGRLRRALLKAATAYTNLSVGLRLTDTHNGLRAMTREVAAGLRIRQNGMAHASEILEQIAAAGHAYVEHPVEIDYSPYSRAKGQPALNAVNILTDLLSRGPR